MSEARISAPVSLGRSLFLASRPKTLSASLVPIAVATSLVASQINDWQIWISLFCLLSAMLIQIATNFINDALDFVKGADRDTRLGETRATQAGWMTPQTVLRIGMGCLVAALLFGIPLVLEGGWPIFWIGVVSLALGYGYTGGPFPLAYIGLGDLFVILFFGLVAVGGVYFLHMKAVAPAALVAGLQVGLLATVLIAINNLRDVNQDREVNKKTLAVRLGLRLGRFEVVVLFAVAYALGGYWWMQGNPWAALLPLLTLPIAIGLTMTLLRTPPSPVYNRLLARASIVHMLFGSLLSAGLILS